MCKSQYRMSMSVKCRSNYPNVNVVFILKHPVSLHSGALAKLMLFAP